MRLKRTLAGFGAAATVMGGAALAASPALAQDATTDSTSEAAEESPQRHGTDRFAALTEVLGIDATELHDRLHDGETVAEIAAEQNVAVDDVITALLAEAETRLDAAVEDERLTAAEADERILEIEERITAFVNGEIELGRGHGRSGGHGLGAVVDLLGLDGAELREQLQAGATLGDIATAQGVSVDDLADALAAPMVERVEAAVADGSLTQEEADERLAEIEQRVDDMLSGDLSLGDRGPGRHGRNGGPGEADSGGDDAVTGEDTTA